MDQDALKAAVFNVQAELHRQFPNATDRLAQLDSHAATVAMVVDLIFEEAAK